MSVILLSRYVNQTIFLLLIMKRLYNSFLIAKKLAPVNIGNNVI